MELPYSIFPRGYNSDDVLDRTRPVQALRVSTTLQ